RLVDGELGSETTPLLVLGVPDWDDRRRDPDESPAPLHQRGVGRARSGAERPRDGRLDNAGQPGDLLLWAELGYGLAQKLTIGLVDRYQLLWCSGHTPNYIAVL